MNLNNINGSKSNSSLVNKLFHTDKYHHSNLLYSKSRRNNGITMNQQENYIDTDRRRDDKIIGNIRLNWFFLYCCFCCVRKRKNLQNILIDEGMDLIKKNLDLQNIFKKMQIVDNMEDNIKIKWHIVDMSEECKYNMNVLQKEVQNVYYNFI